VKHQTDWSSAGHITRPATWWHRGDSRFAVHGSSGASPSHARVLHGPRSL